jgi:ubiquinone/menaquinone biosynthesis C-methylase UbiE
MNDNNDALLSLPIDQYSRQKWVSEIINYFRNGKKTFRILDVGGYKGKTTEFHPEDKVTICDLYDVDEKGYVKGDGRKLPFKDGEFDFVVTFDTYEHVPRNDRKKFIEELNRVSVNGVILAAPFDDDYHNVSEVEISLNNYHISLYKKDHQWLKEHIDYRIPHRSELDKLVKGLGLKEYSFGSNRLDFWILMQTLYFSVDLDQELRERLDEVNNFYNRNLKHLDLPRESFAYRRIYFISNNQSRIEKVKNFIEEVRNDNIDTTVQLKFMTIAMARFGIKYRDVVTHNLYLDTELKNTHETNKILFERLEKIKAKSYKTKLKKIGKRFTK